MSKLGNRPLVPLNIRDLSPYVAGKTIAEVKEEYDPPEISKLASNENRLGCSSHVQPQVVKAMQEIQDYPDPASGQLREVLADENNIDPENIIVGAGSESLIANLCRTFFLNNEEAVTADATFVGFFVQGNIRGISIKKIPVTDDYRYDLNAMADAISERTKMVYIANPNNPTGTYITRSEFEQFMRKVPSDVLVVMDEAYFEFAQDVSDYPHSLRYDFDNVITLRTFSKAYGLAGFRVGYGIASKKIITEMMKTKLTFEPTVAAQAAALAALGDPAFLKKTKDVVNEGKKRLYKFFEEHGVSYVSSISNSVMMVLPTEQAAIDFTQKMLEQGVILRRINAFGLPNCVRITIGRKKEMRHFERSFKNLIEAQELPSI
ncbi:histidinol-phosphate aminotransferase [Fodinibius salinus]|uniref:Histidinol-phosphate aminotransferase n=1 Tax=Fodinibius salinus TaxID=860790 RepID=A0A5D3YNX7_9BACT|nr:histidinol-phosphate transaminase [Fodinibius salinus]TYP94719.1 histidinol-phosphate aminotransferase [Fodinibius salinus]